MALSFSATFWAIVSISWYLSNRLPPKCLNIRFALFRGVQSHSHGTIKEDAYLLWPNRKYTTKNIQLYHGYCQYVYTKYNCSYHISSSAKHTQRPGVPHLRILRSRLTIHEGPWQGNPSFNQQIQGFPWNPREPGVLVSTNTYESNVSQGWNPKSQFDVYVPKVAIVSQP